MDALHERSKSRRRFLQYLAASPLFAEHALAGEDMVPPNPNDDPARWVPPEAFQPIEEPAKAVNVFDFERVAYQNVPPAHFGYMAGGVDQEVTLRANRADFLKYQMRPRRLQDVSKIDMSLDLFGAQWGSPIFVCPTGGNAAYHPDAEIAVSKAAEVGKHLQMLSTLSSTSIDDCIKARGGAPIWFQLYVVKWEAVQALVKRAEAAGAPVLTVTIDVVGGRKNETLERMKTIDPRTCTDCHTPGRASAKGNFEGLNLEGSSGGLSAKLDWDLIRRIRDLTKMKIVLKGILSPHDAALCVKNGVDAIYVSNHGGRAEDGGTSTIGVLQEIVQAVGGRTPILVDSGFRRGMDVAKALAMGATAVGVGRPYLWGLGAFGQEGVERVLEILRAETKLAMGQLGARTLKELTPDLVHKA